MQEEDDRCATRSGDVANEDRTEGREVEVESVGEVGNARGRRAEGEVGVVAQIDSTFSTVTVSAPLGAS